MAEVIRDEDVRARVRAAQEFLDPGTSYTAIEENKTKSIGQRMRTREVTDQISWLC